MKPCHVCGEPSHGSRCPDHDRDRSLDVKASSTSRGYDTTWLKLSERARRAQPWCSDCFSTEDLTTDHSERAWQRKAEGKAIRLRDVTVLCRSCNAKRGRARPWGETPAEALPDPDGKAQSALHTRLVDERLELVDLSNGVPMSEDVSPALVSADERPIVAFSTPQTSLDDQVAASDFVVVNIDTLWLAPVAIPVDFLSSEDSDAHNGSLA